jgi:hypothetical protein
MKAQMEETEEMHEIIDKFMELPQECRDGIIVYLFCRNASLNKKILAEAVLGLLAGVRDYVNWGLKKKTLSKIQHDKGIEVVKGLYDVILQYAKSQGATDDEKA